MTLTDTHCHLDFHKFDADRSEVLHRARKAGVTRILIPGITVTSSRSAVKLAEGHPMLYAAIGVHPTDAKTWTSNSVFELRTLAQSSKVVAIGEIGLDYYWDAAPHDVQQLVLEEQLALASELNLPVILHMREARDALPGNCSRDLMKILEEWMAGEGSHPGCAGESGKKRAGVLHSFSGSLEVARQTIHLGFYIGVTGPVTFLNARTRQATVAELPLERLLTETDAPFLAPDPHRGQRNEPAYIGLIADKIAVLQNRPPQEVADITTGNAQRLFGWEN